MERLWSDSSLRAKAVKGYKTADENVIISAAHSRTIDVIMSLPAQKFRTNRRPIQPGSSLEIAHGSASATHSQQPSSRTVGSSETPFSASSLANSVELEQDDLLRSFDDLDAAGARKSPQRQRRASEERDGILLGEDSRKELESANNAHRQGPSTLTSRIDRFDPMHVNLPPRPSEISPDYAPPLLSPRRLSQVFSSHGPGPQPQVSDAGRDIIFHPSFDPQSSEQGAEVARPASTRHSSGGQSTVSGLETSSRHGLAQSMLFNTLASTTKLAAKWKHVLEPSAIAPSDMQNHPHQHVHGHQTLFSSGIAQAIDITHSSPFASAQQIAGSYVPPGGAPGFDPSFLIAPIHVGQSDDFSGTRLLGRRDGTVSVLLHKDADKVGAIFGGCQSKLKYLGAEARSSSSKAIEHMDLDLSVIRFPYRPDIRSLARSTWCFSLHTLSPC